MVGMRAYIDTNILIYFFNKGPSYLPLVSCLVQQCADRKILGTVSLLVLAEVLVLPCRGKNLEAVAQIKAFLAKRIFYASVSIRRGSWRKAPCWQESGA